MRLQDMNSRMRAFAVLAAAELPAPPPAPAIAPPKASPAQQWPSEDKWLTSKKLIRFVDYDEVLVGFHHYCPGCKSPHGIYVQRRNRLGAMWTWDGNVDAPTIAPSVRCFHWTKYTAKGEPAPGAIEITDCHYFLKGGMLQFLGDCRHELAAQTVPLPDYPERWR